MAKLVIFQSDGRMREMLLDRDRLSIGRRPDHDLCLPFPAVSADHAEIITVVADSFLHDLGSTNGTIVNGERVAKHFLRNKDEIEIGREKLVYLTNEAQKVEPRVRPTEDSQALLEEESEAEREHATSGRFDVNEERFDAKLSPVDELLTDLMEMHTEASAAVDIPPPVSAVATPRGPVVAERAAEPYDGATAGVYVEVMSGPNAGQISPMTKAEFVLGKAGAPLAVIRRDADGYLLVPLNAVRTPNINGRAVDPGGTRLEFGDTIGVGGVTLRFNRRAPL